MRGGGGCQAMMGTIVKCGCSEVWVCRYQVVMETIVKCARVTSKAWVRGSQMRMVTSDMWVCGCVDAN